MHICGPYHLLWVEPGVQRAELEAFTSYSKLTHQRGAAMFLALEYNLHVGLQGDSEPLR